MTEREKAVAALRGLDRAITELILVGGVEGSRSWAQAEAREVKRMADSKIITILDRFNNDGLPETEPIRPEEWQAKEATC